MDMVINYAYLRDLVKINEKNVYEILFVSDYLGIIGLMKYCIDFIIRMISNDNCIVIWLMSRYVQPIDFLFSSFNPFAGADIVPSFAYEKNHASSFSRISNKLLSSARI